MSGPRAQGPATGGRGRPGGMGPGGMMMGGPPPEKSKNFGASFRRLLGRLRPEAPRIAVVLVLAVGSVAFAGLGPKILGDAPNIIFEGFIGSRLPAGTTQAQVEPVCAPAGRTSSRTCSRS